MAVVSALLPLSGAQANAPGPDSRLPIPRFVSLAVDEAYGRHGPSTEHRVDWIYQRVGLPLQVVGESGPWRRVRDPDGAEVWMHQQNLAPRQTVYVTAPTALRRAPHEGSAPLAYLAAGVVGGFTGCDGAWRRMTIAGRVGWVRADAVWGGECAAFH
jgi:SH3-like domain-containing protein